MTVVETWGREKEREENRLSWGGGTRHYSTTEMYLSRVHFKNKFLKSTNQYTAGLVEKYPLFIYFFFFNILILF